MINTSYRKQERHDSNDAWLLRILESGSRGGQIYPLICKTGECLFSNSDASQNITAKVSPSRISTQVTTYLTALVLNKQIYITL